MSAHPVRFVVPHDVSVSGSVAVVSLPATGAVHRLVGPAAAVVKRLAAGDANPSLWSRDEQDAVAILCDLGIVEFPEHDLNRRAVIAGAAALGITTILMPTAVAAASDSGGAPLSGGRIEVRSENSPSRTTVSGESLVQWLSGSSDFHGFTVLDEPVLVTYLTVGGGAGGGGGPVGGGGGGGQVRFGSVNFPTGQWQVRVGNGGNAWTGAPGGNGVVGNITNLQLGFTATGYAATGASWPLNGNGGPGGNTTFNGGTGSGSSPAVAGGGGGGAGGAGGNSSGTTGGDGGVGVTISNFFATDIGFGGGGGGGGTGAGGTASHGGGAGGTTSTAGTNGTTNRGGGGGGAGGNSNPPGAGGSGIVAIRTAVNVTMLA